MIDPRKPNFASTPASPERAQFGYAPAEGGAAPLLSIVTPYFNTGRVFHETAVSVFRQSLQQWEWIIVDDASTDADALAVLDEYRDSRIRIVRHDENRGLSAARNTGFREARAELVFQLDSDDLIEPTALEKCLWYLHANPRAAFVRGFTVGFEGQEYLWTRGFNEESAFLSDNLATATTMIRKSVHAAVGGYQESLRGGMEDWDFWLRCAAKGYWGSDLPEFLDWYRRRKTHGDRWPQLESEARRERFREEMVARLPALTADTFPNAAMPPDEPMAPASEGIVEATPLAKTKPRLLMILPWLRMGGADKFNLDLVRQLTSRGWEVTIATLLRAPSPWGPDFARHTPDIFFLHTFLNRADYPAFLRHLIRTRRPDVVMVSNSELGYQLLPYLRANCPEPAYVDYCHMEEEQWKNGGYPRYAIGAQELLDLNIVASEHLKRWMSARGADESRIDVAYINVDANAWKPDAALREATRRRLGIANDMPVILFAGRVCPQKRPLVFAKTIRALAAESSPFVALVAGDGEDGPALREYVEKHGLKTHVKLLGEISVSDMPAYFHASDIFFLPSEWEGIALSIYESMAAGLAVVGAVVGGQKELVTEGCGFLIPKTAEAEEITGYVDALRKLIRDADFRKRIGTAARQRIVDQFDLGRMGDRMVELLGKAGRLRSSDPRPAVGVGVGRETARQAIEFARMSDNLEELWRMQVASQKAGAALATAMPILDARAMAENELVRIENSRFWRAISGIKRIPPYPLVARWRFGPNWDRVDRAEDPRERLARIKTSSTYRFIQAVKGSAIYRWYARQKYGERAAP